MPGDGRRRQGAGRIAVSRGSRADSGRAVWGGLRKTRTESTSRAGGGHAAQSCRVSRKRGEALHGMVRVSGIRRHRDSNETAGSRGDRARAHGSHRAAHSAHPNRRTCRRAGRGPGDPTWRDGDPQRKLGAPLNGGSRDAEPACDGARPRALVDRAPLGGGQRRDRDHPPAFSDSCTRGGVPCPRDSGTTCRGQAHAGWVKQLRGARAGRVRVGSAHGWVDERRGWTRPAGDGRLLRCKSIAEALRQRCVLLQHRLLQGRGRAEQ